ncbi:fibrinogen-binding adhesin SdrG C-terminal domain-containing protein [Staphylococcus agnetis]|nr:fibrinogen-binding adhesin SdrG C-terminal domain-containing protein [Staphylococcus agnetis]ALN76812.1 YSIRK-type signal peptide-containing protein [Staphylococcus agnetis]MDG4944583.1 fibrinogen-binding adhesin SdrG C-terminal domain-containing protein [Staphylococcus agnetis]OSP22529.1 hypothetical protein B9L42_00165 [Staphylococcus agnetis]OSP23180.1 hypothetical protein B9M87_09630 [Staphylococcus agnetis]
MNNTQRYGIRKYKIGAASIALGTVVVIGMGDSNEASASEQQVSHITTSTHSVKSHVEERTTHTEIHSLQQNVSNENLQKEAIHTSKDNEKQDVSQQQTFKTEQQKVSQHTKPENIVAKPVTPKVVDAPQKLEMTKSQEQLAQHEKGLDVTDKVTVIKSEIKGHEGKKIITPHQAERITLNYKWKFDNRIKSGDHFHFNISNNVDTQGIAFKKKVPEIKDNNHVVARGEVLENNKIRYTFTDYVNYKKDINAELSLNLYFNPVTVPNKGRQTVVATLGNKETKATFKVNYLDGVHDKTGSGVKVNGRIHKLDKENRTFTHIAYINPDQKHLNSVDVVGYFRKGGTVVSRPKNVQIYEYVGKRPLAQSVYADFNTDDYKEVTKNVNLIVYDNGQYKARLGDLNGKAYVIRFDGQYLENANDLSFATELTGHHYVNGYYRPTKLTWLNGVTFYSNNAHGSGQDRPFNGQSEHIDFTYDTYKPEHHTQQGVLKESYDSKPIVSITESGSESGHAKGQIVETEDTMTTDYITEQHLIEYQEELHIKRGSHKNIWFEEDTNEDKPSIQTGAHHPIKIQDNTLPKVSGETKGVITEEDSKPSPLPKHSNENNLEVPQPPVAPKGNEQMEKDQHQSAPKIKDNSKIKQHRKISKEEINHQKKVTPQIKSETPKNKKEINTTPSLNDNHRQGSTEMTKNIKMTHKDYKESHRPSLPETGQSSNHHSYIIGTVLSFFGFSFIVRRKCEKRH